MNEIVWTCFGCKEPIDNGDGYLGVEPHIALSVLAQRAAHTGARTIGEILDEPEDTPWVALHAACDFNPQGPGYWVEIDTVRTHAQLLRVTSRLHGKTWLEGTDWFELLERAGSPTRGSDGAWRKTTTVGFERGEG